MLCWFVLVFCEFWGVLDVNFGFCGCDFVGLADLPGFGGFLWGWYNMQF